MTIDMLSPKEVFKYFSDICDIPHGSGNTDKITEYIIDFAKKRGLEYRLDSVGNLAVYKDATPPRVSSKGVILQAHIDMVCAKREDCELDMDNEGIRARTDGEFVWADGTTLGADDGIGVSYILALLDAEDIDHPQICAIFTVDEEVGMTGAGQLDPTLLRGTRLINIDSEEEGIFIVSCAGGSRAIAKIPVEWEESSYEKTAKLSVSGLVGGHSGIDIGRGGLNAIVVIAKLLSGLKMDISIGSITTSDKLNVIPQGAWVSLSYNTADEDKLTDKIRDYAERLKAESNESGLKIKLKAHKRDERVLDKDSVQIFCDAIRRFPNGVIHRRGEAVEASLNIGMARLEDSSLTIGAMLRSNAEAKKDDIKARIIEAVDSLGGSIIFDTEYPSWEYRRVSPLRDTMISEYREMFGREPKIESIHAGLECGLFAAKCPELDMVSIGPDLVGVHTPEERLSVSSTARYWEYIKALMGKL